MAKRAHQPYTEPSRAAAMLRSLGRLVGTWEVTDPNGDDAIEGHVVFEWMVGRRFMIQQVNLDGAQGLEIIGYDEATDSLRSHYFDSSGQIVRYRYELEGDSIAISVEMEGRRGQFTGTFADNGNSFTGRWVWGQNGSVQHFDATMTKVA